MRIATTGAGVMILLASAHPAIAQRAEENAVNAAEDGFGTSVGNERVGIYLPTSARGFSPVQAGNVRIDGLYFDYQTNLNDRLVSGSTVRVGLTAQGYPFPAPTGVADFGLRLPDGNARASVVAGIGPYGGPRAEFDAQLPLAAGLAVAGGVGVNFEGQSYGGHKDNYSGAILGRWRPAANIDVIAFWSVLETRGDEGQPIILNAGAFLPFQFERRRYFGPAWAQNSATGTNQGALATIGLGDWTVRGGLFRSVEDKARNYNVLYRNASRTGDADIRVVREDGARNASTSGELRLTRKVSDGDRLHQVHFLARGRLKDRAYGGSRTFDFGRGRVDEAIAAPEPDFTPGPQTFDTVRQGTLGLGYEGRWRDLGELTLGVQRSFYEKEVVRPTGPLPVSRASPWLFNGAASIIASERLVFYAGYSKGLEESPVAPEIATNRGEAPPAIITEQIDAGLRYALTPKLKLVAGVFDVRKPHFALDPDLVFRQLGERRNRGIELSLAGQLTPRLGVVAGALLLDAEVSGDAVELGLIGSSPLGATDLNASVALNWAVPWLEGLSLDAVVDVSADRTANSANTLVIPARYAAAVGGRYRFALAGKPASIRAQWQSLNDVYSFNNIGEGFYYNPPRRFQMNLTVDF